MVKNPKQEEVLEKKEIMKLEYLVLFPSESSFCRDAAAFKSFLQSDSDIKVLDNKIRHRDFQVDFELKSGHHKENKHRFYHLKINTDSGEVERLSQLGRAIKKMLGMSDGNFQGLWDDTSFYYAQMSYPHIHEIENLMRKLITKFMLTNVGLTWAKQTTPDEIKKDSRNKFTESNNYLYEVDFIKLSNFLFDDYKTLEITALVKKISEVEGDSVRISEISDFIPKSNWKRYFEPHVDCDATYLQSRWSKLYELRCKIAHNKNFTKDDYESTISVSGQVRSKLENALDSLEAISVPEEDREELVESVASSSGAGMSVFLNKWKLIELHLKEIHRLSVGLGKMKEAQSGTVYKMISALADEGLISRFMYKRIREAQKLRNIAVHEFANAFSESELILMSKDFDDVLDELEYVVSQLDEEAKIKRSNKS